MRRLLRKLKRLTSKEDFPPPYEENVYEPAPEEENASRSDCQILDLLAACKISDPKGYTSESEPAGGAMGMKHSTPWGGRHRSKISLTWVLREQGLKECAPLDKRLHYEDFRLKRPIADNHECNIQSVTSRRWRDRSASRISGGRSDKVTRIVGRSELYRELDVRGPGGTVETSSEGSGAEVSASERGRRRRRRRKRGHEFGYEIKNIDGFLAEASIEQPGNIPVVLARASTLYETGGGEQREVPLPLGTVLNAVFRKRAWLYVQTPHALEGYVQRSACLPLGILPTDRAESPRRTPCWESSGDVYPRPCGNATDADKRLRARTESRPRRAPDGERGFDKLYMRAASVCELAGSDSVRWKSHDADVTRQTLLVIGEDYSGAGAVSVRRGEVVALLRGGRGGEWFRVRTRGGAEGHIPARVAGHGFI